MKIMPSRRLFLKTCAAAGTLTVLPGLAVAANAKREQHTETRLLLGTFVSITAVSASTLLAGEAIDAAFAEIVRLQNIFDRRDSATPLAELNRSGRLKDAPPELLTLTGESLKLWKILDGAFDISVAPLVDLMAHAPKGQNPPGLDEARTLVDSGAVTLEGNGILLKKSGMALTFDGIAKGSIADSASKALTAHGCPDHLINAGGDIVARGLRPDGTAWKLGVRNPDDDSALLATMRLHGKAVATSGTYEQHYDAKRLRHHLIHPQTGISQPWFKSVSVTAASAQTADALATALSAMPPDQAMRTINALPGCAALFLGRDGRLTASSRWI